MLYYYVQATSLLVMLPSPTLRLAQTLRSHGIIPRNQPHLKVPWNSNERRLKLVVINIVRVRRRVLARNNLVRRKQPKQRRIEQPGRNVLARAGARACAKAQMGETGYFSLDGGV